MVTRLMREYFKAGGEMSWLDKTTCPDKMKAIVQLSNILAYRPWAIDEDFFIKMKPWSKN